VRIKKESEILKASVRKKIIEEIEGSENKDRKREAFRRYMTFKDQTKWWVIKLLEQQFDQTTIREMSFSFSNISIVKKVINKLARVFNAGVDREVYIGDQKNDDATQKIEKLAKKLHLDEVQQNNNRVLKLERNTALYLKPCPKFDGDDAKWTLVPQVIYPYLYDVVEDYYNRTKPLVYIFSNYEFDDVQYTTRDAAQEGRSIDSSTVGSLGDGKDQAIADEKLDEGEGDQSDKRYIWWSDSYHFTTDSQGTIVDIQEGINRDETALEKIEGDVGPGQLEFVENAVGEMPIVDYAIDQDNSFWAKGGNDLPDSAITINALISHLLNIGVIQGYGQFFMRGMNLPHNVTLGPNKCIRLEMTGEENEPTPDIGFANGNPQLDSLMRAVEMEVALLLSTNNLSTNGVSMRLDGAQAFPSALAMMLDKAESMEDVQEQRKIFTSRESDVFRKMNAWIKYFEENQELDEDLEGLSIPVDDFNVAMRFRPAPMIMSESDKLDNVKKRQSIGLDQDVDLVKIMHGDLSDEEAKDKLERVKAERMKKASSAVLMAEGFNGGSDKEELDESEDDS
jgi:hypothetical protein